MFRKPDTRGMQIHCTTPFRRTEKHQTMKKLFLNATTACLSLLTYYLPNAQSNSDLTYHSREKPTSALDAKVNPNPKLSTGNTVPITQNEVGIKVARSFIQIFKDIASVDWFKENNQRYLAKFQVDGKKSRALFERN